MSTDVTEEQIDLRPKTIGPIMAPDEMNLDDPDKLLIGRSQNTTGDLPRNDQGLALIGDARNDTHLFISQLHLAFLHFHNRIVDRLRGNGVKAAEVFDRSARIVRTHYQWIVLHEFLPLTVGEDLMSELQESGTKICRFEHRPFILVEFSDAAYRFGHAQIRDKYDVNNGLRDAPLFPDLVGICPVTPERKVDWRRMFRFDDAAPPQPSRRLSPQLVPALMRLPEALVGHTARPEFSSLASRDLYRGHGVDLPCGEDVARAMGLQPCSATELQTGNSGLSGGTPLWLYVLAEADAQRNGEFLGAVGGRIVAEVIFELLRHDPDSTLNRPEWTPELAHEGAGFGIADFLSYAGVV